MNRKELLEKFIKENFNLKFFKVIWEGDFLVTLEDTKSKITFISYDGVTIDCCIDGEYFNSYTQDKDLFNNEAWFVINKRREENKRDE